MPFPLADPIRDPVLIFALAMGIFLLAPALCARLKVPGIVGLILAGTLVGPHVLNLLERDFTFELLGQVGLLYLVFLAGLELDLHRFAEYRSRSIVFGLLSFGFPLGLAIGVMPLLGFSLTAALLVGAIIGSHTLLAYPTVGKLGIAKNPAMITVIGGTLVTDTLALTVLAVVSGAMEGNLSAVFWVRLFGVLALYVAAVVVIVPRVGRWFFRSVPSEAPAEFIFLMVVLFATAWAASLAGAQPIIGAFLAGLALNRLIPLNSPLMTRVRFVGNALFIPFFLLSVGMLVDPRVLGTSARVWVLAAAFIGLVHAGKLAGAWASRALFGYSRTEGLAMFGLSLPQAAATLAVTFVGLEIGLFAEDVVNAVIVMIVVTVFVGPWLVERHGREIALQEEARPYDPSEAPRRILIPISNPATADALMDIAFLLRGKGSQEPIYPLMVVRDTDRGSEAQVAEAEKMLSHAVLQAAAADVPVSALTRVDPNIASGVARAMVETRASIAVVGWDGRTSGVSPTAIFGTVLDQLLDRTRQTVIVAKMGHPLNTTARMVVVVPPGTSRHPGVRDAVGILKTMASELEATIHLLTVARPTEPMEALFRGVRPEVPLEAATVPAWDALPSALEDELRPEDLVVVLSARPGTVSWHRELTRLPAQLAALLPESFLVVHPSDRTPSGEPIGAAEDDALPTALTPERIRLDLPGGPYRHALRSLLQTRFADEPTLVETIVQRLALAEDELSSEVLPGVAVPHAMVAGIEEPIMFLGVSRDGISFPKTQGPIQVVILLLGPAGRRQDHLRGLGRLVRTLRHADEVDTLRQARDVTEVVAWFAARERPRPRSVTSDGPLS